MTRNEIATPLATALSDRGYETLTAVQEAVLAPEARGRDLLVSAQTGSGKTVAFGISIAPDLLDASNRLPDVAEPLALAIAPTRELALQVAAELTWLYVATGARIATCVGGMDYRAERRVLARGAQIVVGTPGRLRDHIERGGLDLAALRVAVLDEADEMLDLGFREDLEFILQSAPENRRTLMFSATVPAAIEKLARDFQRDALRLAAMGEARQHGDIAYRALTVAARDRENAIFNLLRYHEARTAIVFCRTRANVNHLLARMNNRGFRAVALSGELSQQERTHALQALRDGRSRVCIATDVAARGIDLPGLELVIHADLPTNAESLLHRSGRTGRAGAKGVSALIVAPSEAKKAQRLLQGAKVVAEWGHAPSAEEVSARDDARLADHPALRAEMEDMTLARALLARFGAEQVAAALVALWREGRPPPEELTEPAARPEGGPPAPRREFGPSIWFSVSVGRSGRAEARWLLPKICEAGSITRDTIGAIRIREEYSFVQVAVEHAGRFGEVLEIAPGVTLRRMEGEPVLDQPSGGRPAAKPARKPGKPAARPAANALVPRDPVPVVPVPVVPVPVVPAKAVRAPSVEGSPAPSGPAAPRPPKARWTAERKAEQARKAPPEPETVTERPPAPKGGKAAGPKAKGRFAGKDTGRDTGKPAGKGPAGKGQGGRGAGGKDKAKFAGKPGSKAGAKAGGKRAGPRKPRGGYAPPRRPRGQG